MEVPRAEVPRAVEEVEEEERRGRERLMLQETQMRGCLKMRVPRSTRALRRLLPSLTIPCFLTPVEDCLIMLLLLLLRPVEEPLLKMIFWPLPLTMALVCLTPRSKTPFSLKEHVKSV